MSTYEATEVHRNWFTFTCPSCNRYLVVNFGGYSFPSDNVDVKFGVKCCFCESVFGVGFVVEAYKEQLLQDQIDSASSMPKIANVVPSHAAMDTSTRSPRILANRPNDLRANTKNPNNAAHRAALNNRSNQINPNSPAYRSSRSHR